MAEAYFFIIGHSLASFKASVTGITKKLVIRPQSTPQKNYIFDIELIICL